MAKEDKVSLDYTSDYNKNFIADTCKTVKNGQICFVYRKEILDQVENKLKELGVKYTIKAEHDFYEIIPTERK